MHTDLEPPVSTETAIAIGNVLACVPQQLTCCHISIPRCAEQQLTHGVGIGFLTFYSSSKLVD